MYNIAVLGFGTVGGGVYEVLRGSAREIALRMGSQEPEAIEIKYILDKRKFPGHPLADRVTEDYASILSDARVSLVVETLGGLDFAYQCSVQALRSGKSVVTSNKAVVDRYGAELEALAARHGVRYLYEASVGGGIPIIRPLHTCLAANRIERVAGILNGTTNYILTKMRRDGMSAGDALREAQRLGYAEADPQADVAGLDAARKIAILAGIAFQKYISFDSIPIVEGIERITTEDVMLAAGMGYELKLIALAERREERAMVLVAPSRIRSTP